MTTGFGRSWEVSWRMPAPLPVALALALAAPTSPPAAGAGDATVARVVQRLAGTWQCVGPVLGSTSREVYRRTGPTAIALDNAVHTARGLAGVVHETFAYDARSSTWQLSAPMNRFFDTMQLGAPVWHSERWVFNGSQTVQNVVRPTRIVYTSLGPDVYRREHQTEEGGVFRADGAFVCRRSPTAPARFVPAIAVHPVASAVPSRAVAVVAPPRERASTPSVPAPRPRVTLTPQPFSRTKAAIGTKQPASGKPAETPKPIETPKPPETEISARPAPVATARRASKALQSPTARVALAVPEKATILAPATRDRAYTLVGLWSCKTFGGLTATHAFAQPTTGTLLLHNVLRINDRDYVIDEAYRYNAATGSWSNVTQGGAYVGTAGRWLGATWVFDGTIADRQAHVPVKMTYVTLGRGAFLRRFERRTGAGWVTYAAETCQRRQ